MGRRWTAKDMRLTSRSYAKGLTPATLRKQIASHGAVAAARDLRQVERADAEWVAVAVDLRPGADAGSASMLRDSMFVALRNSPGGGPVAGETRLRSRVCGGRAHPLPTFEEAVRELDATIASVSAIQGPSLAARKRDCLVALEGSRQDLRRFFDKQAQPLT